MEAIWTTLYDAAKSVLNERKVSDYVLAGGVGAAILSESGRIYTGICVDTCSTLGICAERNAIFNMLTNGDERISKVVAVMEDGSSGAPCGACHCVHLLPHRVFRPEARIRAQRRDRHPGGRDLRGIPGCHGSLGQRSPGDAP